MQVEAQNEKAPQDSAIKYDNQIVFDKASVASPHDETVEKKMRSTAIAALIAESSGPENLFNLPKDTDVPEPDILFE